MLCFSCFPFNWLDLLSIPLGYECERERGEGCLLLGSGFFSSGEVTYTAPPLFIIIVEFWYIIPAGSSVCLF